MAGTFPRRQAVRLAGLLSTPFVPGLICLEAPPRRGKSDFLRQLFGALLGQRAVAPVLLSLGSRRLLDGAIEQAAAQLLGFAEGRLRSPAVLVDRALLAEREDAVIWHEFLAAGSGSPAAEQFFLAAAMLAERVGPICLLLDDAPEEWLRAAALVASPVLATVAAPERPAVPAAAQVLALEEFTVREGLLLAEGLARAMGIDFSGEAAEPFVAYTGSDPFVLQSVLRGAAAVGTPLNSSAAFVGAYLNQLRQGSLASYFREHLPGGPGSLERRFALETLSGGALEATRLSRWRHRIAVDDLLDQMQRGGWVSARGAHWALRPWPAARDWSTLEAAAQAPDRAAGLLTLRLLADLEKARRTCVTEQVASHIAVGLRALVPTAATWLAENGLPGAQVPEVCHVAREEFSHGQMFFCYGFAEGQRRLETAALLVVAVLGNEAQLAPALEELNRHAAAALPTEASGAPIPAEKWVVLKNPGPSDLQQVQRAGVRLMELGLFNRLLAAGPEPEPAGKSLSEVVLTLPMKPDFEIAAVRVLDQLLEQHNCDKRSAGQARIALVEACLNAIEHGRATPVARQAKMPAQMPAQMEVRLRVTPGTVEMVVTNPGPPFQPQTGKETDGAAVQRGHGLKIIHSLTDRVSFSSDLNGTTIRMTKHFTAASQGGASGASTDEKAAPGIERN